MKKAGAFKMSLGSSLKPPARAYSFSSQLALLRPKMTGWSCATLMEGVHKVDEDAQLEAEAAALMVGIEDHHLQHSRT